MFSSLFLIKYINCSYTAGGHEMQSILPLCEMWPSVYQACAHRRDNIMVTLCNMLSYFI